MQRLYTVLSVSHVSPKTKQPAEVFRGGGGDFLVGNLQQTGQGMGGAGHKGGFVALAAVGSGSQPGSVGLDQNPIQWDSGGNLAQGLGFGIGEIAGKRDEEAQGERAAALLPSATKAVHHAAQAGRPPVGFKDFEEIVPGVAGFVGSAAVDEYGALAGGSYFELPDETRTLDQVRSALVVVVEADFAAGNDFRLGEQAV